MVKNCDNFMLEGTFILTNLNNLQTNEVSIIIVGPDLRFSY